MVRALSFSWSALSWSGASWSAVSLSVVSLCAVALTLLTAAPGTTAMPGPTALLGLWDDDPSPEERLSRTGEVVEQPSFLGPVAAAEALREAAQQLEEGVPREYYFTRVMYSGFGRGFGRRRGGGGGWATDYPKADQIFLSFIDRLLPNIDAYEREHPIRLDDPAIRRFPFLYVLEVGGMALREPEIEGLRDYLLAGGFLVVDDFWGTRQWANFEYEIQAVLPGYEIVDLSLDHPIFSIFYEIDEILQVPNRTNGVRGGPTHQSDGYIPWVKGIYDENGRLMVVINWNTDLGDAWEWADDPDYPFRYSMYAYEMGVNMIVYAMTH